LASATSRWAARFGYFGPAFFGWARQPGRRTVEGDIRAAITRRGVAGDATSARLEVASRTDRGVSARANVLALSSDLSPGSLLRALNAIAAEIFFTDLAPVEDQFRVRAADERHYRYFLDGAAHDPATLATAAREFGGLVDARTFGRGHPIDAPALRPVHSVTVQRASPWIVVDVRAPAFVWGMVRKIVAALTAMGDGRLTLDALKDAVSGRRRLTLPLAPPEPLVLWDIRYAWGWPYHWSGLNRRQARFWTDVQRTARLHEAVLGVLAHPTPAWDGSG
jgi:tRNA pseudouridine38-40 synthase